MNVVAITPARGGSKGVPRKNVRVMAGKPLLQYTIEAATKCTGITRHIVNTEDPEIREVAESLGVQVQGRPECFWHDNTFQEVDRLLQWSVRDLEASGPPIDVVVLLYATSPLRPAHVIDACINLVAADGYDSALTLREDRSYLWRRNADHKTVEPVNYDPAKRGPNQLEGWNQWAENKAVYAMRKDLLMQTGCRLGGRIGFVPMPKWQSIDIDTPEDFHIAEQLLLSRRGDS